MTATSATSGTSGTAATLAWLTWRQLFARRRVWLAVAVLLLPVVLTFMYRLSSEDQDGARLAFMSGMSRDVILAVLLPITAIVFGTIAFGGEVEDGTLVYLLVKPLPRWLVVVVKYVVAAMTTALVICTGMLLAWLALRNHELPPRLFAAFALGAVASSLLYCALFVFLGLVTRRGLVFGLLYLIVFENLVTRNLAGVRWLSIREYAVAIAQWVHGPPIIVPGTTVPMSTVWVGSAIILAVSLGATVRALARYELAERL